MLRRLEYRMTLTMTAMISVVLLLILVAIFFYVANMQVNGAKANALLGVRYLHGDYSASAQSGGSPRIPFSGSQDSDDLGGLESDLSSKKIFFATVLLDDDDNVVSQVNTEQGQFTDLNALKTNVEEAVASGEDEGLVQDYTLYFLRTSYDDSDYIIFTNFGPEKLMLKRLAFRGGVAYLLAVLIFTLISFFLAKISLRPTKRAWEQQQQFIADASHELKTPLTAILANNNILIAHGESSIESQRKWIDNSQAEATHMKELVNNMLTLARSDATTVPRRSHEEVSLSDLITDVSLQFEPVAFETGSYLETDIAENIKIKGDRVELRQLAYILIDNAIKYSGVGGMAKVTLLQNGHAKFIVHNTGTPISSEDLPHIFERFYRSDKARTKNDRTGGYGLGLAIAKNIVERHRGQISATSDAANGTTFTVTFKK